jgi:hypothetical protein
MIRAAVSGSFRKHMHSIANAVSELHARRVEVLSPSDPTIVDQRGEFLFVASDRVRSVRLVQDRHMEAIRSADFLWLVCPDGYVGQSASMEIGFAAAVGTPVFSAGRPDDLTLLQYVHHVESLDAAVGIIRTLKQPSTDHSATLTFALDPLASLARAHASLDRIGAMLSGVPQKIDDKVGLQIYQAGEDVRAALPPPPGRVVDLLRNSA